MPVCWDEWLSFRTYHPAFVIPANAGIQALTREHGATGFPRSLECRCRRRWRLLSNDDCDPGKRSSCSQNPFFVRQATASGVSKSPGVRSTTLQQSVTPAKAGVHSDGARWTPAFAGVTDSA